MLFASIMPATRSSTRIAATIASKDTISMVTGSQVISKAKNKRKANDEDDSNIDVPKKARKATTINADKPQRSTGIPLNVVALKGENTDTSVPATLTFDLDKAKRHLVSADHRFEDLFNKMPCKPYENLESFHPFQALSTSILGQQISWLAARSIIHKFKRLYDQTLPEKPGDTLIPSFPSPRQVAATDLVTLKSAGLSTRKAEYIQDLAKRFADGRMSTEKILSANDEELAEMLVAVRGIGRWTVDMFAIFSLRRPDILPVGDLGVQRGVARWVLALHSPSDSFSISPQKVSGQSSTINQKQRSNDSDVDEDYLPVTGNHAGNKPSPSRKSPVDQEVDDNDNAIGEIPLPFTPSIKKTLEKDAGKDIRPLPKSLSVAELKSRLGGKKKIKGALLTPQEMEGLTEGWKPYRSIGVYYMWSLASAD